MFILLNSVFIIFFSYILYIEIFLVLPHDPLRKRQQQTLKLSLCGSTEGVEQSRLLGAEAMAFTIDGLQPDEALVIGVAAVIDQRVGEVGARRNGDQVAGGALLTVDGF